MLDATDNVFQFRNTFSVIHRVGNPQLVPLLLLLFSFERIDVAIVRAEVDTAVHNSR